MHTNRSIVRWTAVLCLLVSAALLPATCFAQPQRQPAFSAAAASADEALRIERLAALGRLWGAIKYFHPYLGYREDIDWDKAGVEGIAKVSQAKNAADYANAVDEMLKALGDPATKVVPVLGKVEAPVKTVETAASATVTVDPSFRTVGDGVLVVSLHNFGDYMEVAGIVQRANAVVREIPKAKAVIFDLRPPVPFTENQQGATFNAFRSGTLGSMLTASPVPSPGERSRMHVGFVSQRGNSSGGYESAFFTAQRPMILSGTQAKDLPVIFLVNRYSEMPSVALALQAAGKAAIVSEGPIADDAFASAWRFKAADGIEVKVRLGELVYPDGTTGVAADEILPESSVTSDQNPAFQRALALAANFKTSLTTRKHLVATSSIQYDKAYADMAYPAREYRVLAAFKIWSVINYFFPYKDLMGEDWDAVLREYIPKLESAGNALDYNLTVAEMVTRIHDGHGFVSSTPLREYFGVAPAPVHVEMVEGLPVVISFPNEHSEKDAKEIGFEIGDVILKVDGEDAKEKIARFSRYTASSTPQWLAHRAVNTLLNGPDGSTATVTVRDVHDQIRELKVPRKASFYQGGVTERRGEPYKLLSPAIGYADLDRLELSMVDDMFEKFKDTKAIIFDDRTYPHGTAWSIAPRLTEREPVLAAEFTRRVPMFPDSPRFPAETIQVFKQSIPRSDKWKYKGKTVMLIDQRTISQAEHTGLFLEAAGGTKFIGSPTAGANGDVTSFPVPGGIWINMTGQAVRHIDGRQLQRVGLKPDVEVRPTIKGLRAGKDEVLERAIKYLREAGVQ